MGNKGLGRAVFAYSSVGIQLAATVTLFILGGHKLDNYLNKAPLYTSIGAFLGMAIGFYNLIRELKDIERVEKLEKEKEKNDENLKRNKWLG